MMILNKLYRNKEKKMLNSCRKSLMLDVIKKIKIRPNLIKLGWLVDLLLKSILQNKITKRKKYKQQEKDICKEQLLELISAKFKKKIWYFKL